MSLVVKMASHKTKTAQVEHGKIQYPWLSRLKQNLQCQATKKKLISHSAIFYDCNHKYQHLHHIWVFPKIGVPKMDGLLWKTLLKWMIWGAKNPYFWFNTHISSQKPACSKHHPHQLSRPRKCILSSLNFGGFRLLTNHPPQKKMKVWKIMFKKKLPFQGKIFSFHNVAFMFLCVFIPDPSGPLDFQSWKSSII